MKILVGGHSDVAMRRAARHDGWISANCTEAEIAELVTRLRGHLEPRRARRPDPTSR